MHIDEIISLLNSKREKEREQLRKALLNHPNKFREHWAYKRMIYIERERKFVYHPLRCEITELKIIRKDIIKFLDN